MLVGAIVGVAAFDAAAGAQVEVSTEGMFDLAKVPADALTSGMVAKVTPPSGTIALAGTAGVGWVVQNAASGSTTVRVRLGPSVGAPPTVLAAEHQHEKPAAHHR